MNVYVVVEGEVSEKIIYRNWVTFLNPDLVHVDKFEDIVGNNFFIVAGYGYPSYFDVIDAAVEDVNSHQDIQRLVIAVDSEESSFEEKETEIASALEGRFCRAEIYLIVQHFCLEAWALGNRVIVPRNSANSRLQDYLDFYNVVEDDPAELPAFPREDLNRASFAFNYLKFSINHRNRQLTYSKSNPGIVTERHFFDQVRLRHEQTGHIGSFSRFLEAFSDH